MYRHFNIAYSCTVHVVGSLGRDPDIDMHGEARSLPIEYGRSTVQVQYQVHATRTRSYAAYCTDQGPVFTVLTRATDLCVCRL